MLKESRVKKSLLNARINLLSYFASLVVAFFTRKILLEQLGVDFIGLTSTLQSMLSFLNLAELGVGAAIGYSLYKPIVNGDHLKINEIISVMGYIYRCIGLFILIVGILLSLFIPLIFSDTPFSLGIIFLGFYAYLSTSLLGYFVNYKQTLLSADQRNYEVTGYYQGLMSLKVVMQMFLALYVKSFSLFLLLELAFGVFYSIILTSRVNKVYPWLKSDVKLGRLLLKKYPEIAKYVKQLFVHKVGELVQGQTIPLLVYSYVSLPVVAIFGNYQLLTGKIQGFMVSVMDGTSAGVGQLVSEGDKKRIWTIYKELFSVRTSIASVVTGCTYFLISPFISLWLGSEYVLNPTVTFLICVSLYLSMQRGVTDQFLFAFGLFYDVWAPLTESAIFVIAGMIGGSLFGLQGVLLGPIISKLIIVYMWKPYFLFSRGFNIPIWKYWLLLGGNICIYLCSYHISVYSCTQLFSDTIWTKSWITLLLKGSTFFIIMTIFCFSLNYLIFSNFRNFIHRFLKR